MANDQVFLHDQSMLKKIGLLLGPLKEPVLEVGAGSGKITQILCAKNVSAVEMDPYYRTHLENIGPNIDVHIGRFQDLTLPNKYKTLVSNLPFNQILDIIFHVREHYSAIETYYVIVPKNFYLKFCDRGTLGYKIRHHFNIKKMLDINGACFKPKISFNTVLLKLEPHWPYDDGYLRYLSHILRPHKKLKNAFKTNLYLKNKDLSVFTSALDRRLNTFTDEQFYKLYCDLKTPSYM